MTSLRSVEFYCRKTCVGQKKKWRLLNLKSNIASHSLCVSLLSSLCWLGQLRRAAIPSSHLKEDRASIVALPLYIISWLACVVSTSSRLGTRLYEAAQATKALTKGYNFCFYIPVLHFRQRSILAVKRKNRLKLKCFFFLFVTCKVILRMSSPSSLMYNCITLWHNVDEVEGPLDP